jgi:hypothetical protein
VRLQSEVRRACDGVQTDGQCEARPYRSGASLETVSDGLAASCRKLLSDRQMASSTTNLNSEMRLIKFLWHKWLRGRSLRQT